MYELVQVTAADASRAADLIEQYSDLPLGTADAIVVAVAEKIPGGERRHPGPASLQRRTPLTRSGIHTAPVTPTGWPDIYGAGRSGDRPKYHGSEWPRPLEDARFRAPVTQSRCKSEITAE